MAEIDSTLNLDPDDVRTKITPRTQAIMLVHMLGNPGRIDEIKQIADEHNLYLIEDCAQALGATYKGTPVGSYRQIGTFSLPHTDDLLRRAINAKVLMEDEG